MAQPGKISLHDQFLPSNQDFLQEVTEGLIQEPKLLPTKFLYDKKGSELFDAICQLECYYPTRTEKKILRNASEELAREIGQDATIIELGSGSHHKISLLLELLETPHRYVAVDISQDYMLEAVQQVQSDFPSVEVGAICADYTRMQEIPEEFFQSKGRRIAFFPGSTIGNFHPPQASEFLATWSQLLQENDLFLCGVDLIKSPETLEKAYNDDEGVTAEFNLNLLHRMNRELHTNFDTDAFAHRATYNTEKHRIEMHLVCQKTHEIVLPDPSTPIQIREGESIRTECSYKYSISSFQDLATRSGFQPKQVFTDPQHLFSVHLLEKAGAHAS